MDELTCSERDAIEVARLLALLAPDMAEHPEEYTIEAIRRRNPEWPDPTVTESEMRMLWGDR